MDLNTDQPPPSLPIAALMNLRDQRDDRAWVLDLNFIRDEIKQGRRDLAWSRMRKWRAANKINSSTGSD